MKAREFLYITWLIIIIIIIIFLIILIYKTQFYNTYLRYLQYGSLMLPIQYSIQFLTENTITCNTGYLHC